MASNNLAHYGEFFLKQGRPEFPLKGCVILCVATYEAKPSEEARKVTTLDKSYPLSIHAEESILRKIEKREKASHSKAIRIEFYASYSPCNKCCKLIEEFLRRRPRCEFSIAFTCVYRHDDELNRSALRGLNRHGSVSKLDVFQRKEWSILQDNGLLALTRKERKEMIKWDAYWRQKLEEILTEDKVDSWELLFGVQLSKLGAANIPQFESQCCDDMQTDGATQFEDIAADYEEEYFQSLAELEEMEKRIREAMRRRDEEERRNLMAKLEEMEKRIREAMRRRDEEGRRNLMAELEEMEKKIREAMRRRDEEERRNLMAELEEMEKKIREAMRRRDEEERRNLMVCGTLIIIPLCLLGFLITRYVL